MTRSHDFTKSEKEVCNMVAKEGRASPAAVIKPDILSDKERDLSIKCIRLIQGRIPCKEFPLTKLSDVSPSEDTT
ncbi:unnamed protein product, partial [Timema podura]|nr:unnamed protein product [Timema podura]